MLGCDLSGTIVQLGTNAAASGRSLGEHVVGFVLPGGMSTSREPGAFAQYVRLPAALACALPDGWLEHERAAAMGLSFWEAYHVLYHPKQLGLIYSEDGEWIYIHGGSCESESSSSGSVPFVPSCAGSFY